MVLCGMNPIDKIVNEVAKIPGSKMSKDVGDKHEWLDISLNGRLFAIEWREAQGLGVSEVTEDSGFGEGHDRIFGLDALDKGVAHALDLVRSVVPKGSSVAKP